MERYQSFEYSCECPKCSDTHFIVFDSDLECEIGLFDSGEKATEFIATRVSQDVIHRV